MKTILILVVFIGTSTCLFSQPALTRGDHFALINGIKLHYYVKGKGPVCLLPSPGWGPSIGYLTATMNPLEDYFTIVYYDTRISGKSSGPSDTTKYRAIDFMEDMDALRVFLHQDKVWIMGHSGGGFQVLNYGIHHTDHLNGIIALDALAADDSLRTAEQAKVFQKREGQPYYGKGAAILLGKDTTNYTLAESTPLILPFYFHDPAKMTEFLKLDIGILSEKANQYTGAARLFGDNLLPDLRKIKVPILVVVGDDDFECDKVSQADRIAKNTSMSTEIVITNAGHFCWFEQPTQFFNAVEGWLKKQGVKPD